MNCTVCKPINSLNKKNKDNTVISTATNLNHLIIFSVE